MMGQDYHFLSVSYDILFIIFLLAATFLLA